MRFLRPLHCFIGMFHGLLGMLVPGQVIFFPVMRGGGAVRVRSEFMELRGSLMRVIWHAASRPWGMIHLRIILFFDLSHSVHMRYGPHFSISVEGCLAIRPTRS